jgi:hypothetical protein
MQTLSKVIITYKHIETERYSRWAKGPQWECWQAIVQETAYREDGTAYPSVVAIAENKSKASLAAWAKREGYTARQVEALDLTPNQASLFA